MIKKGTRRSCGENCTYDFDTFPAFVGRGKKINRSIGRGRRRTCDLKHMPAKSIQCGQLTTLFDGCRRDVEDGRKDADRLFIANVSRRHDLGRLVRQRPDELLFNRRSRRDIKEENRTSAYREFASSDCPCCSPVYCGQICDCTLIEI